MQNQNTLDNIYDILQILRTHLSKVYLVRNKNDNNQYVAKVILNNIDYSQNELQMTTIASGLNNPNIIHLIRHGVGTLVYRGVTKTVNYMILEYCPKGNLFNYVRLGRFTERQAKYIFRKILLGVQGLHTAGYCHRDLKLENILLDQNFNPKINDFLFATQFQQNNQPIFLNDFIGTISYTSPQIILRQPYNGEKADIFSLGVILFILVTGHFGFNKATNNDQYYREIANGHFNLYWARLRKEIMNLNLSDQFKDLYIRMVNYNENNRPNITQILQHQWFNEIDNLNAQQLNELEIDVRNEFIARNNQLINMNDNIDSDDNDDNR